MRFIRVVAVPLFYGLNTFFDFQEISLKETTSALNSEQLLWGFALNIWQK